LGLDAPGNAPHKSRGDQLFAGDFMRWMIVGLALTAGIPAAAQEGAREDSSTIRKTADAVTAPLDGKEVPEKLRAIQDAPYSLAGLKGCAALQQEVRELNAVLGPDVDEKPAEKTREKKREETAGRVAATVAASAIPMGGLIGEVTGANAERRRYALAVYAGTVRRGFLKGVGLQRGCKAPARP
jgi:hypothetical protein